MNPFEKFGIKALSPSSLNLWRSQPGTWTRRYLGKIREDAGAAAWRGDAVEEGYRHILLKQEWNAAYDAALSIFEQKCVGEISDTIDAERDRIEPMMRQCIHWENPPLNAHRIKVTYRMDGVPVPIEGWLDFAFEGIDVDLKSTTRLPSEPRPEAVRQVSLYRAARNRRGGLLYVSEKKHSFFEIDDAAMKTALRDMREDAIILTEFLKLCPTAETAMKVLPVDWDDFRAPKVRTTADGQVYVGG